MQEPQGKTPSPDILRVHRRSTAGLLQLPDRSFLTGTAGHLQRNEFNHEGTLNNPVR